MEGKMRGVTLIADWEPGKVSNWGRRTLKESRRILAARYGEIQELKFVSTTFRNPGRGKYWLRLRPAVFAVATCIWRSPMRKAIYITRA